MNNTNQTKQTNFTSTLREKVFLDRYALKGKTGELLENAPEEMWKRLAKAVAQQEKKEIRKNGKKNFMTP